ncbi:MAG: hypothetical protein BGO41_08710 [Clostridiales bacterium 38-18]|nr:MAG: hypothetical protein BGO41_08710 [Clostridiales bacterium 38-18]
MVSLELVIIIPLILMIILAGMILVFYVQAIGIEMIFQSRIFLESTATHASMNDYEFQNSNFISTHEMGVAKISVSMTALEQDNPYDFPGLKDSFTIKHRFSYIKYNRAIIATLNEASKVFGGGWQTHEAE